MLPSVPAEPSITPTSSCLFGVVVCRMLSTTAPAFCTPPCLMSQSSVITRETAAASKAQGNAIQYIYILFVVTSFKTQFFDDPLYCCRMIHSCWSSLTESPANPVDVLYCILLTQKAPTWCLMDQRTITLHNYYQVLVLRIKYA